MLKHHAADFWNKGAPLKSILNTPAEATGATFNKFMQAANRGRITEVLERRGIPTAEIKNTLMRGDSTLTKDLEDAARLKQLGETTFNVQAAETNRAKQL